jgi:hypothetical protein
MAVELPPVVGDPAGMRALASALRSTADAIAGIDSSVYGRVSGLSFTGPAATRIAGVIDGWHGDVSGAASSLQETAGLLERSAATVEREQIARLRLQHQLEEQERQDRSTGG